MSIIYLSSNNVKPLLGDLDIIYNNTNIVNDFIDLYEVDNVENWFCMFNKLSTTHYR